MKPSHGLFVLQYEVTKLPGFWTHFVSFLTRSASCRVVGDWPLSSPCFASGRFPACSADRVHRHLWYSWCATSSHEMPGVRSVQLFTRSYRRFRSQLEFVHVPVMACVFHNRLFKFSCQLPERSSSGSLRTPARKLQTVQPQLSATVTHSASFSSRSKEAFEQEQNRVGLSIGQARQPQGL